MTMFQTLHRTMARTDTLKLRCESCGHRVTWTYGEAVRWCGPDATPTDIRRRVRCKACGAEGRVQIWI